jgi:hypothetical protein
VCDSEPEALVFPCYHYGTGYDLTVVKSKRKIWLNKSELAPRSCAALSSM